MTVEEYLARVNETLIDAGEVLVLVAEKVKPLGILDEELVARLDALEHGLLTLIAEMTDSGSASPLDEIWMAHELRRVLWEAFGERSVPCMSFVDGVATLDVRGSDGAYRVTIAPNPEPWFTEDP